MADLDLRELDRLEREMHRTTIGGIYDILNLPAEDIELLGNQLRPLLDLVKKMGTSLEALTIPLWSGVGFPPSLAATGQAYAVLQEYRRAKREAKGGC